jgi:hypothetical protein
VCVLLIIKVCSSLQTNCVLLCIEPLSTGMVHTDAINEQWTYLQSCVLVSRSGSVGSCEGAGVCDGG